MVSKSNKNFYERIRTLSDVKVTKNVNESTNNSKNLETYTKTDDGNVYGVIRENHKFYIKKSTKQKDFTSQVLN